MRKITRFLIATLTILFVIFNLINLILIFNSSLPSFIPTTGKGLVGTLSLFVERTPSGNVTIVSPENITYYFNIGEPYIIDLNVSTDFPADFPAVSWWYTVEDLKHSTIAYQDVIFTPNSTVTAVRWSNKLTVHANNSDGSISSKSAVFYVSVPNSPPIISGIPAKIYACEGNYSSYNFNINDVDESRINLDISHKNPFYVTPLTYEGSANFIGTIFSGSLSKINVGDYFETISAIEGQYLIDTKTTNITVIEINNPPGMDEIGVQTIWLNGENSTFYKPVKVSDIEDGDQDSGNFTFNISFLNGPRLFDINNFGVMSFTPNSSNAGVYNISVCVKDKGITNPHANISLCGQNGSGLILCKNFSLTITNENRAPFFKSYYPLSFNFSADGTNGLYFNISKYDADGTAPDAYWSVDNILQQYNSGSLVDEFRYTFGCDAFGSHLINVTITDGLVNKSVQWDVTINLVQCPVPAAVSKGGGGAGGCSERWVSDEWSACQNANKSLASGLLDLNDYNTILKSCLEGGYNDFACGFQIRNSHDISNCNNKKYNIGKPRDIRICYYTQFPTCFDGITNCHDNLCELLVDCGGPCKPCPTCSDNIQNQKEGGIDCGGPCPWKCLEEEKPLIKIFKINYLWLFLIIILLAMIVIIYIKINRIIHYNNKNKLNLSKGDRIFK